MTLRISQGLELCSLQSAVSRFRCVEMGITPPTFWERHRLLADALTKRLTRNARGIPLWKTLL